MRYTINTNAEMIKYFLERTRVTKNTSSVSIKPKLLQNCSERFMAGNIQTMDFFALEKLVSEEVRELGPMNKLLSVFLKAKWNINLKITNKQIDQNSINAILKTTDRIMRNLKAAQITYNQPMSLNLTNQDSSAYCVDNNIFISDLSEFIMTLSHELGHVYENQNSGLYDVLQENTMRAGAAQNFNNFLNENINFFKYSPQNSGNTKEKLALVFEFLIYASLPREIDKKPVFLQENKDADIILIHKEQLEKEYRSFATISNDLCITLYNRTKEEQEAVFSKKIQAKINEYKAAKSIAANTKQELIQSGLLHELEKYLHYIRNAKNYGQIKVL